MILSVLDCRDISFHNQNNVIVVASLSGKEQCFNFINERAIKYNRTASSQRTGAFNKTKT